MDDIKEDLPPALRNDMVNKAVDFLKHPKIQSSSIDQRKAFLSKKGLTDVEILEAIKQAGPLVQQPTPAQNQQMVTPTPQYNQQMAPLVPYHQPPMNSRWLLLRDFLATAVVTGGVGYAIYKLLKHYLAPGLFKPSKEAEELRTLQKSIKDLHETVKQMVESLKEQSENTRQVALREGYNKGPEELQKVKETQALQEIKAEVTSLKGLMLNRRQFPPTPMTQPVLPAWQIAASNTKSEQPTKTDATSVSEATKTDATSVSEATNSNAVKVTEDEQTNSNEQNDSSVSKINTENENSELEKTIDLKESDFRSNIDDETDSDSKLEQTFVGLKPHVNGIGMNGKNNGVQMNGAESGSEDESDGKFERTTHQAEIHTTS